jgi:hypothetical protein
MSRDDPRALTRLLVPIVVLLAFTTVALAAAFNLTLDVAARAGQATATLPNTLTPGERAAGWRLLFDGKSTAGWHTFGKPQVVGWRVADGELIALGQGGDHANDIVTDEAFENFELVVEWKLSPRANSGIFFNVVEKGYEAVYATGPEYQLIDDAGWPDKLEAWQQTAANYAMHLPTAKAARPVGQWNATKIVVNKGHVQHWLNGAKVVEYDLWTPDWEARVKAGKWKDYPGYGRAKRGLIGLQDHGNQVFFRGIKIRTLS